jgi:hypothetical protein
MVVGENINISPSTTLEFIILMEIRQTEQLV